MIFSYHRICWNCSVFKSKLRYLVEKCDYVEDEEVVVAEEIIEEVIEETAEEEIVEEIQEEILEDDFDDSIFDDNWDEISDDEDDVKVFVPEVPAESEEDEMFASFEEVDINDPVFNEETAPAEDFEIDFSMFEVDEAKKQVRMHINNQEKTIIENLSSK